MKSEPLTYEELEALNGLLRRWEADSHEANQSRQATMAAHCRSDVLSALRELEEEAE